VINKEILTAAVHEKTAAVIYKCPIRIFLGIKIVFKMKSLFL
jgi:hypothetical protein